MAALVVTEMTLRAFTAPFSNGVGWRKDAERARSQLLHALLAWWGVRDPRRWLCGARQPPWRTRGTRGSGTSAAIGGYRLTSADSLQLCWPLWLSLKSSLPTDFF
jgi:hypothetical protein